MPLLRPRVNATDPTKGGAVPVASSGKQDTAVEAVQKWIPTEVIAVYIALMGLIPESEVKSRLIVSGAGAVLTALWIAFATKPGKNKRIAWRQTIVSPIAFLFWAAGVQTQVLAERFDWWQSWYGPAVLLIGTVALPIIDGALWRMGITQGE